MDCTLSTNIIRVLESRRIRRAGHLALMGRGEVYTGLWGGKLRDRDHFEYSGVDGRIILRWIFMQSVRWHGLD